jgi:[ribosomal protein S5]-alanine N-acetyltransferase
MREPPTIETARLVLRPFALSDARDVQRLAGDLDVADTTLNIPHPYEDGMAEEWIAKLETDEPCTLAIVGRDTRALLGAIGLAPAPRFARAELGYWIGKPFWGRGYCTEAARALLRYGFVVLDLNRIHASHFARNPASGRVMRKIGMIHEGLARQHVRRRDRFEDLELYGILKNEWSEDAPGLAPQPED